MQTNIKKLPRISKYCNFCDVVCVMTDSCECVTIDLHELQKRATITRVTMVMTASCIEVEKKKITGTQIFSCTSHTFIKPPPHATLLFCRFEYYAKYR